MDVTGHVTLEGLEPHNGWGACRWEFVWLYVGDQVSPLAACDSGVPIP
jgi:hypothetical protein